MKAAMCNLTPFTIEKITSSSRSGLLDQQASVSEAVNYFSLCPGRYIAITDLCF